MYEIKIERKWARWDWRVFDAAGNAVAFGWEISRREARYKSARMLFQLLLMSGLCDFREFGQGRRRSERHQPRR